MVSLFILSLCGLVRKTVYNMRIALYLVRIRVFRKAVLFVYLVIQLCKNDPNIRSKLWVKFTVRIGCFIVRIRDIMVRNTMTFVRITLMLLTGE